MMNLNSCGKTLKSNFLLNTAGGRDPCKKEYIKCGLIAFSSFGWPNEIPSEGLSHSERLLVAKGNFNLLLIKLKRSILSEACLKF